MSTWGEEKIAERVFFLKQGGGIGDKRQKGRQKKGRKYKIQKAAKRK